MTRDGANGGARLRRPENAAVGFRWAETAYRTSSWRAFRAGRDPRRFGGIRAPAYPYVYWSGSFEAQTRRGFWVVLCAGCVGPHWSEDLCGVSGSSVVCILLDWGRVVGGGSHRPSPATEVHLWHAAQPTLSTCRCSDRLKPLRRARPSPVEARGIEFALCVSGGAEGPVRLSIATDLGIDIAHRPAQPADNARRRSRLAAPDVGAAWPSWATGLKTIAAVSGLRSDCGPSRWGTVTDVATLEAGGRWVLGLRARRRASFIPRSRCGAGRCATSVQ